MKKGDKVRITKVFDDSYYKRYVQEDNIYTISYVYKFGFYFTDGEKNFFCSSRNDRDFEYELVDEQFEKQKNVFPRVDINLNTDEIVAQLKEREEKIDKVNHPSHYQTAGGIEVIEYIASLLGDNVKYYYLGNVIKYMSRFDKKNGVEDLEKARFYLNKMIEMEDK